VPVRGNVSLGKQQTVKAWKSLALVMRFAEPNIGRARSSDRTLEETARLEAIIKERCCIGAKSCRTHCFRITGLIEHSVGYNRDERANVYTYLSMSDRAISPPTERLANFVLWSGLLTTSLGSEFFCFLRPPQLFPMFLLGSN
jgi:hypothetical protein